LLLSALAALLATLLPALLAGFAALLAALLPALLAALLTMLAALLTALAALLATLLLRVVLLTLFRIHSIISVLSTWNSLCREAPLFIRHVPHH
jgi:hypothetical protein